MHVESELTDDAVTEIPCDVCGSRDTVRTLTCLGWSFYYCACCDNVWKTRGSDAFAFERPAPVRIPSEH